MNDEVLAIDEDIVDTVDTGEVVATDELLVENDISSMFGEIRDFETFEKLCESDFEMSVFDLSACYQFFSYEKISNLVQYGFIIIHVMLAFVIIYFLVKGMFEPWSNS